MDAIPPHRPHFARPQFEEKPRVKLFLYKVINTVVHSKNPLVAHTYRLLKAVYTLEKHLFNERVLRTSYTQVGDIPTVEGEPDAWANRVVAHLHLQRDSSRKKMELNLSPAEAKYYVALQHKIAEKIPIEENRPTIDVRIQGEGYQQATARSIGILGGIGPLSDAALLEGVMGKLPPQGNFLIHLHSSPPPRSHKQKMKNLPMYLTGAVKFFQSGCQSYVMASNTAHTFHTEMNILARNKLTNLLDQAVMTQFKPGDRVLVLGTKKAYDANLYPNALKRRGITPVPVSEEDAVAIQRFIDATKQHRNPNPEDLKVFLAKYPHSHVLLGCTELPLALHGDPLLEEPTTANTEALFAEFIAKKLN